MRDRRRSIDLDTILVISIRVGSFLVLLMPLIVTRETLFPFVVGKALFARATIEIILALWLVLAYRNPYFRPSRSWVLLAFGIYLAVTILAGFAGVSLQRSLWSTYERMQGIVDLLHWFALTIVLTSVFRTFPDWRTLLSFNLGASVFMALLGAAQKFGIGVPMFRVVQQTDRLDITLGNPTYVGAYTLVNTFVALGFLVHSFQRRQVTGVSTARQRRLRSRRRGGARGGEGNVWLPWLRLFWTVAFALNLWILWLTETRGALLGLVAGFVAFGIGYLIWGRVRALKLAALSMIAIVLTASLFFVLANEFEPVKRLAGASGMVERFSSMSLDDKSIKARVSSWSVGLDGFAARPILGWGPENYIIAWGRYFVESSDVQERYDQERFDQAHNRLLEELTTKGVLGFWSYVGLWALVFWVISKRARRQDPQVQVVTLFIGAALTGYFVQNLFLFDTPATVLQFILLLGFVVSLEASSEESAGRVAEPSHGDPTPSSGEGTRLGRMRHRMTRPSESWLGPSAVRGLTTPAAARTFRSERFSAYGLIVLMSLVLLVIYFANYKPYEAAKTVLRVGDRISWDQRLDYFDRSINSFRPLANYTRLIMFSLLTQHWQSFTESEARAAVAIVEREAERALERDPEGWRLHAALAGFYQAASSVKPTYLTEAAQYVRSASELAPETPEISKIQSDQEVLEQRWAPDDGAAGG